MNKTITRTVGMAMLGAVAWAPPGGASSWLIPAGSAEHFSYANGRDLNGFFGEPVVSEDTFTFPEFHFVAAASDGSSANRLDTLSVDLTANSGWGFGLLRVTAFGNYATSGDPGQNYVDIEAAVSYEELASSGRRWEAPLVTSPSFPTAGGAGAWSGLAVIDLSFEDLPPGEALHLEYTNGLIAVSGPAGSAFIHCHGEEAGGFELNIGMVPIPEPGSVALLSIGAVLMISRRPRAMIEPSHS
jgi:hypothetical protein